MLRAFTLGASALVLSAGVALADPMAMTYENTVVVTNAAGEVSKSHYNADKSYETTLADGAVIKGTWELTDGDTKICHTQTEPAPAPEAVQPACTEFLGERAVGDTWEQMGTTGEKVNIELVGGR